MTEVVELHQAFMWDCPACGRENFVRGIVCEEPLSDQLADAREAGHITDEAIEAGMEGVYVYAPEDVTCAHCGEKFEAKDQMDEG